MTDLTSQIKDQRGGFAKILSKIPGFKGYMEKETRRDADKIVRDVVAARFTDQLFTVAEATGAAVSRRFLSGPTIISPGTNSPSKTPT